LLFKNILTPLKVFMLVKFTHVEDYIEVIAGYRDIESGAKRSSSWMLSFDPIISLARYDVNVLDSMAEAVSNGKALTTRQAELATKIILKYQRQLAQKGVDVSPVNEPQWRMPLRVMDYSKRLYIKDDIIMVEFPFSNQLIEGLREFRKDSQGKGEWNKEHRRWEFDLTEYNLVYLLTWAQANDFEIDDEVVKLNQLITDLEKTQYAIELDVVDGVLTIKNAPNSMMEYVNEHGGVSFDNLARLIDLAPTLGYTVSDDVQAAWAQEHGSMNVFLSVNRQIKFPEDQYQVIEQVLDYADKAQKWPVVIYEPDTSNKMMGEIWQCRDRSLCHLNRGRNIIDMASVPADVKYIHTTVPIKNLDIPLLVSTAGMMFGGDKSLMLQRADKIVYFAADVHTHRKENKVATFESETSN
jgi:hypothetical protein